MRELRPVGPLAVLALLAALSVPALPVAQDLSVLQRWERRGEKIRATTTFGGLKTAGGDSVMVLHHPPDARAWTLTFFASDDFDRELHETTLSTRLGAEYYDYSVEVTPIAAGQKAVLFEATPSARRDAPPTASRYQVAWIVRPDEKTGRDTRWRLLDTTTISPLDGGDELVVEPAADDEKFGTLYRRRSDYAARFCGAGEDVDFRRQTYLPDEKRFRIEVDLPRLARAASDLSAALPDEPYETPTLRGYYRWQTATSDYLGRERTDDIIRPLALGDRRLETAWIEQGPESARGEFATARVEDSLPMRGFRIYPGMGEKPESYRRFDRPTRILVGVESDQGGQIFEVSLPESPLEKLSEKNGLFVELPSPVRTRCLTVLILDVADTTKKDTEGDAKAAAPEGRKGRRHAAISELNPVSILYGKPPEEAARTIIDILLEEDDPRRRRSLDLLAQPYADALLPALRQTLGSSPPDKQERLLPLLSLLPSAEAVPILIDMLLRLDPRDPAFASARKALTAHGSIAGGPLINMIIKRPPDDTRKHASILRLLGHIAEPGDLRPLIPRLGRGTVQLRNTRVRAVTAGEKPLVEPLLRFARRDDIGDAARFDAIKAIDKIGRRLAINKEASSVEASALLELLDAVEDRRSRMRIIRAIGWFRPPKSVERLGIDVIKGSKDIILRKAALEALARFPDDLARRLLEDSLRDKSPDVRIATIRALMERDDRHESRDAVLAYVQRENWPLGLRPAFRFLASSDDPTLVAHVRRAVTAEPASRKALVAAHALEREERSIVAADAVALFNRPVDEVPYEMRRQLVELLAYGDQEAGRQLLVGLLEGKPELVGALDPDQERRLRERAIMSLGHRQEDESRDYLLTLARESNEVDIQLVALRALSFFASPSLVEELEAWRKDAPERLLAPIERTVTIVERRITVLELKKTADEALEKSPDEPTTPPGERPTPVAEERGDADAQTGDGGDAEADEDASKTP